MPIAEKIAQVAKEFAAWRSRADFPVNTDFFKDPLAAQIAWNPLDVAGCEPLASRLVEPRPGQFEYRRDLRSYGPGLAALLGGCFCLFLMVVLDLSESEVHPVLVRALFGVIGLGLGGWGLRMLVLPDTMVFDRNVGSFMSSGKRAQSPPPGTHTQRVPLAEVYALQIVTRRVVVESSESRSHSYLSHQLNLVLRDGRRVNVLDHRGLDTIRADADRLSALLGWKVWDGSADSPAAASA